MGGWGRKTVRQRHCPAAVAGRFVALAGFLGFDKGSDAELVARAERDVLDQVAVRRADGVAGVGGAGCGEPAERFAGARVLDDDFHLFQWAVVPLVAA